MRKRGKTREFDQFLKNSAMEEGGRVGPSPDATLDMPLHC